MLSLILDAGAAGAVFRMIGTAVYASALLLTAADIPAAAAAAADIPAATTAAAAAIDAADIPAATDIEGTPGIIAQPTTIWMGVPIGAAALCLNAQPTTV